MSKFLFDKSRNPLLVKDDVGRAKPTCYDLPIGDFTYGNAQGADLEGAAEITRTWATHVPSAERKKRGVNYIHFNKSLGRAKLADCRPATGGRSRRKEPLSPPTSGFGKQTRASTPIGSVIGNRFATEFESKMEQKTRAVAESQLKKGNMKKVITTTRAAEGHAMGAQNRFKQAQTTDEKPHFKLSKFANVKSTFSLPNKKNLHKSNNSSPSHGNTHSSSNAHGVSPGGSGLGHTVDKDESP